MNLQFGYSYYLGKRNTCQSVHNHGIESFKGLLTYGTSHKCARFSCISILLICKVVDMRLDISIYQ